MLLKGGKILEGEDTIICLFQITIFKIWLWARSILLELLSIPSWKYTKNLRPLFHKIPLETITQAYHNQLSAVLWESLWMLLTVPSSTLNVHKEIYFEYILLINSFCRIIS